MDRRIGLVLMCGVLGCSDATGVDLDAVGSDALGLALGHHKVRKGDWSHAAYDATGSGHNVKEHTLGRGNVHQLEVKWTFDATRAGAPVAPIHANPVVTNGQTFVGSYDGTFYAIDDHGELTWSFRTHAPGPLFSLFFGDHAPIVAGAVLPERDRSVVFGDTDGRIYKLDRDTGALLWTIDVDDHDLGGLWGNSMMVVDDVVYVGLASFETLAPFFPGRTCCSHRGGVVALNLADGSIKWRYETITPDSQDYFGEELLAALGNTIETFGPSGADVWSQPTFDRQTNTIYVGTGQLFSRAPDGSGPSTHDAIVAIDAHTGHQKWATSLTDNVDVFRFDTPFHDPVTGQYFDKDVADQPKVYRLDNGQQVVGAAQKDGRFHVLDAATGAVIRSTEFIDMITGEGGFQSGGAMDDGAVYEHGVMSAASSTVPYDGVVMAIHRNGHDVKWERSFPGSPMFGSVAVANGVLYVQSPFEEGVDVPSAPATWALHALHTGTGATLARIAFTPGRAINGPAIAGGRIYAAFGGAFAFGLATPSAEGGVVCLGLPND